MIWMHCIRCSLISLPWVVDVNMWLRWAEQCDNYCLQYDTKVKLSESRTLIRQKRYLKNSQRMLWYFIFLNCFPSFFSVIQFFLNIVGFLCCAKYGCGRRCSMPRWKPEDTALFLCCSSFFFFSVSSCRLHCCYIFFCCLFVFHTLLLCFTKLHCYL